MSNSTHNPRLPSEPAAYDIALSALRRGETAATVVRRLIAGGASAQATTETLRRVHATLAAERAGAPAPSMEHLYRRVASGIRTGATNQELERELRAAGVDADTAAKLVENARQTWAHMQPQPGASRRLSVQQQAMLVGALGVVLLGSLYQFSQTPYDTVTSSSMTIEIADASISATLKIVPNAVVVAQQLKVRTGPGYEFPVLEELSANEPIEVIGRAPNVERYKVRLRDGREGWIRGTSATVRLEVAPDRLPLVTETPATSH